MSCDIGETMEGAMEGLANEALLILQPFRVTSPMAPGELPMFCLDNGLQIAGALYLTRPVASCDEVCGCFMRLYLCNF